MTHKYNVNTSPEGVKKRTFMGVTFRSQLEADWARKLSEDPTVQSWEYEKWKHVITVNGTAVCTYRPDFCVYLKNGLVEYHEVKGKRTAEWSLKLRLLSAAWVPRLPPGFSFHIVTREKGWTKTPVSSAR